MVLIQFHTNPPLHPVAAHSLAGSWYHLVAHGGSSLEGAEHLQIAGALSPPALWDWEAGLVVEHSIGSHRSGREEWEAPCGCADAASGCPGCCRQRGSGDSGRASRQYGCGYVVSG